MYLEDRTMHDAIIICMIDFKKKFWK